MAEWTREKTDLSFNPHYYLCQIDDPIHGNLKISLRPPYKSDGWSWRFTKNGTTITKDVFRFRSKGRDNEHEENWESIEDLEKAKDHALRLAMRYVARQVNYWDTMHKALAALRAQGKEQEDGEKKQETD